MSWVALSCNPEQGVCFPEATTEWTSENTPSVLSSHPVPVGRYDVGLSSVWGGQVYFYASFDNQFEQAVMASYQEQVRDDSQIPEAFCSGETSALARKFNCFGSQNQNQCVYEDSFRYAPAPARRCWSRDPWSCRCRSRRPHRT